MMRTGRKCQGVPHKPECRKRIEARMKEEERYVTRQNTEIVGAAGRWVCMQMAKTPPVNEEHELRLELEERQKKMLRNLYLKELSREHMLEARARVKLVNKLTASLQGGAKTLFHAKKKKD